MAAAFAPYSVVNGFLNAQTDRLIGTAQATLSQPLYNGGKTQANINRAKNQVMAERANLIAQEQTSFTNAVNAYVGVIQAQQLLGLNINNEQVLAKQLQATNDRFRVGEITRTDVAQAEAALAQATAQRQTAEGKLQTARGTFQQMVGFLPPADLVSRSRSLCRPRTSRMRRTWRHTTTRWSLPRCSTMPRPRTRSTWRSPSYCRRSASRARSSSRTTRRREARRPTAIRRSCSFPCRSIRAAPNTLRSGRRSRPSSRPGSLVDDARRTAVQNTVQAWETLVAAESRRPTAIAVADPRQRDRPGRRGAGGDRRQPHHARRAERAAGFVEFAGHAGAEPGAVGHRVVQVAAAIGRLTARDMHLPVPLYDETAYYNAVKDKWAGLGDYATDQPGR